MSSSRKYQQLLEKNKGKKSSLAGQFFRAANHRELFKVGKSYQLDLAQGQKIFAIASTNFPSSQQDTILGLAGYLAHEDEKFKILVISDTLFNGAYNELLKQSQLHDMSFKDYNITCEVHSFEEAFDLLDLFSLIENAKKLNKDQYKDVLNLLTDNYDVIFWDVPLVDTLQANPQSYFPLLTISDSLSVIISNNVCEAEQVEKVCDFFKAYGMHIKGLLMDSGSFKVVKNEKAWWKRMFG